MASPAAPHLPEIVAAATDPRSATVCPRCAHPLDHDTTDVQRLRTDLAAANAQIAALSSELTALRVAAAVPASPDHELSSEPPSLVRRIRAPTAKSSGRPRTLAGRTWYAEAAAIAATAATAGRGSLSSTASRTSGYETVTDMTLLTDDDEDSHDSLPRATEMARPPTSLDTAAMISAATALASIGAQPHASSKAPLRSSAPALQARRPSTSRVVLPSPATETNAAATWLAGAPERARVVQTPTADVDDDSDSDNEPLATYIARSNSLAQHPTGSSSSFAGAAASSSSSSHSLPLSSSSRAHAASAVGSSATPSPRATPSKRKSRRVSRHATLLRSAPVSPGAPSSRIMVSRQRSVVRRGGGAGIAVVPVTTVASFDAATGSAAAGLTRRPSRARGHGTYAAGRQPHGKPWKALSTLLTKVTAKWSHSPHTSGDERGSVASSPPSSSSSSPSTSPSISSPTDRTAASCSSSSLSSSPMSSMRSSPSSASISSTPTQSKHNSPAPSHLRTRTGSGSARLDGGAKVHDRQWAPTYLHSPPLAPQELAPNPKVVAPIPLHAPRRPATAALLQSGSSAEDLPGSLGRTLSSTSSQARARAGSAGSAQGITDVTSSLGSTSSFLSSASTMRSRSGSLSAPTTPGPYLAPPLPAPALKSPSPRPYAPPAVLPVLPHAPAVPSSLSRPAVLSQASSSDDSSEWTAPPAAARMLARMGSTGSMPDVTPSPLLLVASSFAAAAAAAGTSGTTPPPTVMPCKLTDRSASAAVMERTLRSRPLEWISMSIQQEAGHGASSIGVAVEGVAVRSGTVVVHQGPVPKVATPEPTVLRPEIVFCTPQSAHVVMEMP
ncbi:hypothetical protein GGF31_001985 [Allomyces arbusculus]|nr:hypothetical protein GGF31_001985 [Allomyces arbusculus]